MLFNCISVNSIMQASVTSSIMMILIYKIRKEDKLFDKVNPKVFLIIYSLCLLRMLFPVEFEGYTRPISGGPVWNYVNDFLSAEVCKISGYPVTIIHLIIAIWFAVAAVKLVQYIKKYRRIHNIFWNSGEEIEADEFTEVTNNRFISTKIKRINFIDAPCCMGIFKRIIAIPNENYTSRELEIILKHENEHLRNNDVLIKHLINIICKIYWWNPVVLFVKKNINQSLELNCDMRVLENNTQEYRIEYLETILQEYKRHNEIEHELMLALADGNPEELYERFKAISSAKRKKSIINQFVISFCLLAIVMTSYSFIIQANYEPTEANLGDHEGEVLSIDGSNSYLRKNDDGTYSLIYKESILGQEQVILDVAEEELSYYTDTGIKIE